MAGVHRRLKEAWIGYPLDEVLIMSISGQDPRWLLSVNDPDCSSIWWASYFFEWLNKVALLIPSKDLFL